MTASRLRIAILAHSTNPRGGVVHALELGDALVRLGHDAVVHAPDPAGRGFFRRTACETVSVPATATPPGTTAALVEARVADYVQYFEDVAHRRFDVFHAQDGLSANALATLKRRGLICGFVRTVHHLDGFADPRLRALDRRGIVEADAHLVVSRLWQGRLRSDHGIDAAVVGNGVNLERFTDKPRPGDAALRTRLGLGTGPVFLAVGGVEERKNTVRLLQAFSRVRADHPGAQLVVAGGSSLLDHAGYQARFAEVLVGLDLLPGAVVQAGPVPDDDMPGLYRNADALVFPSVKEGFGLVVLEAMASGLPVVVSAIEPFTDYIAPTDALWCRPDDVASVADAMAASLDPDRRAALSRRGPVIAARHDWRDTARAHLPVYERLGAFQHA